MCLRYLFTDQKRTCRSDGPDGERPMTVLAMWIRLVCASYTLALNAPARTLEYILKATSLTGQDPFAAARIAAAGVAGAVGGGVPSRMKSSRSPILALSSSSPIAKPSNRFGRRDPSPLPLILSSILTSCIHAPISIFFAAALPTNGKTPNA